MPRIIDSVDSVVVAAVAAETYDKVEISTLKYIKGSPSLLKVGISSTNAAGDESPEQDGYTINIRDVTALMGESPKLAAAWDSIVDIMGDVYLERRLTEKLREAQSNDPEGDHSQLETDLTAAKAVVRAAL